MTTPAPPRTPNRPSASPRFSARDLMNLAVFAVLYVVVVFAVGMLGAISPFAMILTLPLAPIAAGIPYMLFLTRVHHAGMVTLFGALVALAFLLMGQPWQSTLLTILVSALADAVLAVGGYRSSWAGVWAYTVFCVWFVGPWIPFLLDPEGYLHGASLTVMGPDYVASFAQVVTVPVVLAMSGAAVVCGFLGGLLGCAVLRKHFERAGLA